MRKICFFLALLLLIACQQEGIQRVMPTKESINSTAELPNITETTAPQSPVQERGNVTIPTVPEPEISVVEEIQPIEIPSPPENTTNASSEPESEIITDSSRTALVYIQAYPENTKIYLDNKFQGYASRYLNITLGEHALVLLKSYYHTQNTTIIAYPDKTAVYNFSLESIYGNGNIVGHP